MVCFFLMILLPPRSTLFPFTTLFRSFPHPAAVVSLSSTIEDVLHVSDVVGEVNVGLAGHSTVPSLPWPPIDGAWSSTTMMVCVTVPLVLLQASTACHVLVSE